MREFSRWCPEPGDRIAPARSKVLRLTLMMPLLLALTACGPFGDNSEQPPDYWSQFHSQSNWIVDDGVMQVELTGFERGHQPGRQSEFSFRIENRRDELVNVGVCIKLIDELEVVQDLGEFSTEVSAGGALVRPFEVPFDEELEPRAYGLAVIIADLGVLVHTVRLGIADDEAGPWLDASTLTCDA